MPRFFVPPVDGDMVLLDGDSAVHISRSLRMRPGEQLTLSDGQGMDYQAEILSAGNQVELKNMSRSSDARVRR